MNNCFKNLFKSTLIFGLLVSVLSCSTATDNNFSEKVKMSLRNVGHHLLLSNQDSTSLVKPVVALSESKYQLSFENQLAIQPDSLVSFVKESFLKADLPFNYLVEVLQCNNNEVAYSYEIKQQIEKGIIPCAGRTLKKDCYYINVRFTKFPTEKKSNSNLVYVFGFSILAFLIFLIYKKKSKSSKNDTNFASIGRFKFYPEQNKLVKEAIEISLSKKECELLSIFIKKPNQIIKRDELTKKVWEDNGVIVGRSLDTYISKLRKKLQDDTSIKLTNIHGVGYKLEI